MTPSFLFYCNPIDCIVSSFIIQHHTAFESKSNIPGFSFVSVSFSGRLAAVLELLTDEVPVISGLLSEALLVVLSVLMAVELLLFSVGT